MAAAGWRATIHVELDGRIPCGADATGTRVVRVVGPRQAQHVTCKRCLASLRKLGT